MVQRYHELNPSEQEELDTFEDIILRKMSEQILSLSFEIVLPYQCLNEYQHVDILDITGQNFKVDTHFTLDGNLLYCEILSDERAHCLAVIAEMCREYQSKNKK